MNEKYLDTCTVEQLKRHLTELNHFNRSNRSVITKLREKLTVEEFDNFMLSLLY